MFRRKHARTRAPKEPSRTRIEDLAPATEEVPDGELTAVSGAMMANKRVSWTSGGRADEWTL